MKGRWSFLGVILIVLSVLFCLYHQGWAEERYTVKLGDSLYTISKSFGVSVETLKEANGLNGNAIIPKQVLLIPTQKEKRIGKTVKEPSGETESYVVKEGDSLYSISKKVGLSVEEIKKLKARYCYLCDAGLSNEHVRDELLSHFTDDATVDFGLGPASAFSGREGLKTFFGTVVPESVSFCMHMVHNPIIEVHGDQATGTWYYEAPTTNSATNTAEWMAGTYEEEYVRESGRWRFASIKTRWKYISPYDEGWAKNRGAVLAALGSRDTVG